MSDTLIQSRTTESHVVTTAVQTAAVSVEAALGFSAQVVVTASGSLSGASVKLQGSLDGTNYADLPDSSQNITADGVFMWNVNAPYYLYVRIAYVISSGTHTAASTIIVKGFTD